LTLSSLTLPTWGGLHDGELCEHPTPERLTNVLDCSSLPTPSANDTTGAESREQRGNRKAGGPMLRDLPNMLPTPTTQDAANTEGPSQMRRNTLPLNAAVTLLPTPAVNDMGRGKTVEDWDAWTDKMKAAHGNGNGHGKSLEIEAQRLLPTPNAADGQRLNLTHRHGPSNPTLLGAAVSIGANTAQQSAAGRTSSDGPHQPQLSLDGLAHPA